MANVDITRQEITSKISAIKKINDNPNSLSNVSDAYKDDLPSVNGTVQKGISSFTSNGNTGNKKDIFGEVIDVAGGFLGTNKEDPINSKKSPIIQSKILSYAKQSANITMQASKQIITDELKKNTFGGSGGCDSDATMGKTPLSISPKSFDFLNVLKINPTSISGKLMYEGTDNGLGDIQFNKKLYENFDSGTIYPFQTKGGTQLFTLKWSGTTQAYSVAITNPSTTKIADFIDEYYSTIEYPNIDDVMKNAMMMTLQGDGTESTAFKNGMNDLNRLTTKIFCLCGQPANAQPLKNNTNNQLNEDETDIQDYFDFNDVEGIDLDDEDSALRRVLKFRDCDNFEIPMNPNHIEDFSYLLDSKTLDENVDAALNKMAVDAYEQSGGSIPAGGFLSSLTGSYILKIPKALISSVLSPKIFFPIAVVYTETNNGTPATAKDVMKASSNLFYRIIKGIFWKFIQEFWKFLKKDLLNFIKIAAMQIISNKIKKIKTIISILIGIITKTSKTNPQSCSEIFSTVLAAINLALNKKIKVPIPSLLLSMSDSLPGYSTDRAYMNVMEKMELAGINTGPIFGESNDLPLLVKSTLEGHSDEMDANSYISIGMKTATIPATGSAAYITPLVAGAGKLF
jgi:hypothetical protein